MAIIVGTAFLFYSNPDSIFGSAGVAFGIVDVSTPYNYSTAWTSLNMISNICLLIIEICTILIIMLSCTVIFDKKTEMINRRYNKERFISKNKQAFKYLRVLTIVTILAFLLNIALDYKILELDLPFFYIDGVKKQVSEFAITKIPRLLSYFDLDKTTIMEVYLGLTAFSYFFGVAIHNNWLFLKNKLR